MQGYTLLKRKLAGHLRGDDDGDGNDAGSSSDESGDEAGPPGARRPAAGPFSAGRPGGFPMPGGGPGGMSSDEKDAFFDFLYNMGAFGGDGDGDEACTCAECRAHRRASRGGGRPTPGGANSMGDYLAAEAQRQAAAKAHGEARARAKEEGRARQKEQRAAAKRKFEAEAAKAARLEPRLRAARQRYAHTTAGAVCFFRIVGSRHVVLGSSHAVVVAAPFFFTAFASPPRAVNLLRPLGLCVFFAPRPS